MLFFSFQKNALFCSFRHNLGRKKWDPKSFGCQAALVGLRHGVCLSGILHVLWPAVRPKKDRKQTAKRSHSKCGVQGILLGLNWQLVISFFLMDCSLFLFFEHSDGSTCLLLALLFIGLPCKLWASKLSGDITLPNTLKSFDPSTSNTGMRRCCSSFVKRTSTKPWAN